MRGHPLTTKAALYTPVAAWLERYLRLRRARSQVMVRDAHRWSLDRVIRDLDLAGRFPQSEFREIRADVVGFVIGPRDASILLVECNPAAPTLVDVGKFLACCVVVRPAAAFLISPLPVSNGLASLLRVYGRYDVLEYGKGLRLRIAQWDSRRGEIIASSLLPPGEFF